MQQKMDDDFTSESDNPVNFRVGGRTYYANCAKGKKKFGDLIPIYNLDRFW